MPACGDIDETADAAPGVVGLESGDGHGNPEIKRVFEIDLEHCPHCGDPSTIIAAIEHPLVIAQILNPLGLPVRVPPRSPARSFDRFQTA
jgi:hypothetical protein